MKKTLAAKELTRIGIFTALTAILSQIIIPLPFSPVPISFGLVAVYLSAILLPPRQAVLTQVCYLLVGAVGMPVFSGFGAGLPKLFGPTGGYLLVYPLMAWIVSFALNSRPARQRELRQDNIWLFVRAAVALLIAHLVLYTGGTLYMSATTGSTLGAVLLMAVYPFIPLDIAKLVFCVVAVLPLRRRLLRMNLLTVGAGE